MAKKIKDESDLTKAFVNEAQQKEMQANLNAYKNLSVYANPLQTANVVGTSTANKNTGNALENFLNALTTKKPTDALNQQINSLSGGATQKTYPMNASPYQEGYSPSAFESAINSYLESLNKKPLANVTESINNALATKTEDAVVNPIEEIPVAENATEVLPNVPLNAPINKPNQPKSELKLDDWADTNKPADEIVYPKTESSPKTESESDNNSGENDDAEEKEEIKPSSVEEIANASYEDIVNKYLNRGAFSYNPQTDAMYQSYLATMNALGQRAMKDTMGQAAALSGGYGSSYAQNVGSQAYNQYLEQANEALPTYYNMAYNRYKDEGDEMLNKLNVLGGNSSDVSGGNSSGKSNITGQQYSKILEGAVEAYNNGTMDAYLDSLDGYGFDDDTIFSIGQYGENYGNITPESYKLVDQSKFLFFNNKGNDTIEVTYSDGSTKRMTIDEVAKEFNLSDAEKDELKKLKINEIYQKK